MNSPISVSTLNLQIKSLIETTFIYVNVEGEISNITYHNSGHIYFSIKDENSTVSCVMFKGNTKYLKFKLENGLKIVINGSLTVYAPRGSYQILCNKIEPSGIGSLALAFEQLKIKLKQKGYFEESNKKHLPRYPKKIAIVTSQTGAAIEDMKKVANHRWPLVNLILIPTLVQGDGSSFDISASIKYADTLNCDIIIIGRGGGSIEDLWSFNEEIVADSIFKAKTPIISAVGHELDYLISDFVSDKRAATPSNAMEIALPDINEHRMLIDSFYNDLNLKFKNYLFSKEQELNNTKKLFEQYSIDAKFNFIKTQIDFIKSSLTVTLNQKLLNFQNQINLLKSNYLLNHPDKKDKNGFVQVSINNKVTNLNLIKMGDKIQLQTPKNIANCIVESVSSNFV